MAWIPKLEAASALGVSPHKLERMIATGQLRTRRDARGLVVNVSAKGPPDAVTDLAQPVKESATGRAPPATDVRQELRGMMSIVGNYRRDLGMQAHRARISARAAWLLAAVMIVVIAIGGWHYQGRTAGHQTDLRVQQVNHHYDLKQLEDDADEARAELAEGLGAARSELMDKQIKAAGLRAQADRLSAELSAAKTERDRVYNERDRLMEEREQICLERDRLMRTAGLAVR